LTDVVMPEMNGRELYEKLLELKPDMKVLFMSGYTDNVIAHRGVLQDGVNFIQKPFSIKQLAHKVGSILAEGSSPD
jgi:FixJ family two-component response regulator